jgi:hypothetical protein
MESAMPLRHTTTIAQIDTAQFITAAIKIETDIPRQGMRKKPADRVPTIAPNVLTE